MPTRPDAEALLPLLAGEPVWARWNDDCADRAWTVGIEEEVMLLDPRDWALTAPSDTVLPALSPGLAEHVGAETHGSALELRTGVHAAVGSGIAELRRLRRMLAAELGALRLGTAAAGMHPFAVWHETEISGGARYPAWQGFAASGPCGLAGLVEALADAFC